MGTSTQMSIPSDPGVITAPDCHILCHLILAHLQRQQKQTGDTNTTALFYLYKIPPMLHVALTAGSTPALQDSLQRYEPGREGTEVVSYLY